jgi:hypothetical protein
VITFGLVNKNFMLNGKTEKESSRLSGTTDNQAHMFAGVV